MPINKPFTTPSTGAATLFHIVKKIEIDAPTQTATAQVQSFVNAAGFAAGMTPLWNTPMSIPMANIANPDAWLVAAVGGPFYGGTVVASPV